MSIREAAQALIDELGEYAVLRFDLRDKVEALRTALAQPEDVMTRFSRINQEMENAGLLHDKAHVDTGKVRAAQSVRTPEMSYRPGSLPMEDKPVAKKPGTGLIVECNATLHDYDINGFPSRIPFEMKPITLAYEGLVVFTPGKLMEVVLVDGSVVIVKQSAPLRDLSDEEIKDIFHNGAWDRQHSHYANFARAIIDAARKA